MENQEMDLSEDLLKDGTCPVIFMNLNDHWPACNWNPEYLGQVLQGKQFKCKIAPRSVHGQVWETECFHIDATVIDFNNWTNANADVDNPLHEVSPEDFSCYIDYKYMSDMFKESPEFLKHVDWSVFGLPGRDGQDSTIWIGSSGASTPCHYDTYGFNLVAQLYGSKRWHLFPPSSSECLYPTRLPYEESSVFSDVSVASPDLQKHPKFLESSGIVVTLFPGQVLYVPRHWWHYVECVSTAVSINTWVEIPSDDNSRLVEAVTRACVSCLLGSDSGSSLEQWVNPNEKIMAMDVNWQYLEKCVDMLIKSDDCTSERLECNKLEGFAEHFCEYKFQSLWAPWTIHAMSSDVANRGKGTTDSKSGTACDEVMIENKFHLMKDEIQQLFARESPPEKKPKLDNLSKGDCHDRMVNEDCRVYVLQPCDFETYLKCLQTLELVPASMRTAAAAVVSSENPLQKTISEQALLPNVKQLKTDSCDPDVRNVASQSGNKTVPVGCSVKTKDDERDRKTPSTMSEEDTAPGLCIKDLFLKKLLHPRVMTVLSEEILNSYKRAKE